MMAWKSPAAITAQSTLGIFLDTNKWNKWCVIRTTHFLPLGLSQAISPLSLIFSLFLPVCVQGGWGWLTPASAHLHVAQ